jgi:predicted kinase
MLKVILCCGIPASGKSTWAKQEIAKDPNNWVRINNDDIRAMMNNSVWSADYERLITEVRKFVIKEALKQNKNVIIDNININKRHFKEVCEIAKSTNKDINVFEKTFFIDLEKAIERDSKRIGAAKVGEQVIRKWWKKSGGEKFQFYKPKNEVFTKKYIDSSFRLEQDKSLQKAIISDLDGTLALFSHHRSPYNASNCYNDLPNIPVLESIKSLYQQGYKVIFCSGREDKYREPTEIFIKKYLPEISYELYMRRSGDMRKDSIIKEEIYRNNIEGKYYISHVYDDRNQVCDLWRSLGLTCFQVAPGNF